MDIYNDTDQDAKVKVSSGGSGSIVKEAQRFRDIKGRALRLRARKTYKPRLLPPFPLTIYFLIQEKNGSARQAKEFELSQLVENERDHLKLRKAGKLGYQVERSRSGQG